MRLGLLMLVAGCVPVTVSHDGAVDFQRYDSVYVAPLEGDGSPNDRRYLTGELGLRSGFGTVSDDEDVPTDTVLFVDLTARPGADSYEVEVVWRLEKRKDGSLVDRGNSTGSAKEYFEASEEALDEVVAHYIPPYRI